VGEHGVADDRDHGVRGEPAGVAAAGPQRGDPAAHDLGHLGGQRAAGARRVVEVVQPAGRHVAEVARGVHQLVVAEQLDERAAGRASLALEPRDQIEDRLLVVAAVEDVAGLHDDERAADPAVLRVDRPGSAQRGSRGAEVAVQIADRDQARRRRRAQRQRLDRARLPDGGSRRDRRDRRRSGRCGCGAPRRRLISRVTTTAGGREDDRAQGCAHHARV
jgi:hypothetical protein